MPAKERRFWKCDNGHVIGEVKHVVMGDRRIRALMLYEHSTEKQPAELPPLRLRLIGDAEQIGCTVLGCGCVRDWHIGQDALDELMSKRKEVHEAGLKAVENIGL